MERIAILILLMAYLVPAAAQPQPVVTRCVSPSGHGYFYPGLLVKGKDAGWQREQITNGQYLVMRDKEGAYDIVFTDAVNRTISATGDGGKVIVVNESPSRLVLLVHYPSMNVETWMFALDARGTGTASISQARYGEAAPIQKHSLMVASCSR